VIASESAFSAHVLGFLHPTLSDPPQNRRDYSYAKLSVSKPMIAPGDARREIAIVSLKALNNLLYLIRVESDDQLKVAEYATLAEMHVKTLSNAIH